MVPLYTKHEVCSFRYADDQVVCCRYRSDSVKVLKALKQRPNKYGLELNAEKTKVVTFNEWAFPQVKQDTFDYLGFTFYIRRSRKGHVHVAVKTARKRFYAKLGKVKLWCKLNRDKQKLLALWEAFNSKLRGHVEYYGVSLNPDRVYSFVCQLLMDVKIQQNLCLIRVSYSTLLSVNVKNDKFGLSENSGCFLWSVLIDLCSLVLENSNLNDKSFAC